MGTEKNLFFTYIIKFVVKMDKRLLKLYVEKFAKNEINFHGIKLKLSLDTDDNALVPILIEVENPLDKPYTMFALEGAFIRSFQSFVNILGENPRKYNPLHYGYFLNGKHIYISKEFDSRIKTAGKTIKTFNIHGKDIGDYTMDLKYRLYEIDVIDDEIEVNVKFTVERLIDNTNKEMETIYLGKVFDNVYEYGSIPDLNSDLCSPISSVIYSEPTFFARHDAYMQFNCDYYTKAGTRI